MKFTNDRQRKAAFYNMRNKFAKDRDQVSRERYLLGHGGVKTDPYALVDAPKHRRHDYDLEQVVESPYYQKYMYPIFDTKYHDKDIMSIEEALRSEPVVVTGYTGADLVAYPGMRGVDPHVHFGDDEATGKDTYILAGKDFEASDIPRLVRGTPEADNAELWLAKEYAKLYREEGMPVYARKPEIYTREVKDAASLLENIIEKDGFPAGENFLDSMTRNDDRNVRAWAERNLELLQSRGLYKKIVEDVKDAGPEGGESALLNKAYVPTDLAEAIALDTKRMKDVDRGSLDRSGSKEWRGTEDIPSVDDNSYLASQWFNDSMKKQVPDVIILPGEISKDV